MIRINYDALGIAASTACAIHCAILPLVLTSLPVLGVNIIDNTSFEYFMIVLALGIGSYSLWHGYKKHHHKAVPLMIFSAGIVLLFFKTDLARSAIMVSYPCGRCNYFRALAEL